MSKKAYVYTRVSTLMQVDGNSLEGQLKEIEKYCEYAGIEIIACLLYTSVRDWKSNG